MKINSAKEKSFIDASTGLYNQDFFFELSKNLLTISNRYNRKTSFLYISVDNFDEIKKTFGEAFANNSLKSFSHKLKSLLRKSDSVARLSEDSIGIYLAETNALGAILSIRKIENIFAKHGKNGTDNSQSFKFNMAHSTAPEEGKTIMELIVKAKNKLEQRRNSLIAINKVQKLNFWELIDSLTNRKLTYSFQDSILIPSRGSTVQCQFSSHFIEQLQEYIIQDAMINRDRKGLLFLGIKDFESQSAGIQNYHAIKNIGTLVYVIGLKGKKRYPTPYVIPVYLSDEKISLYRFIFYLSDRHAYGLIGKEESENHFFGFHSSDFYFVEYIISKLQQTYFY